jgi:ADP-ribosylglycohydrolase
MYKLESYETVLNRAQGCLLGQLAGDALGSTVEFQTPKEILKRYPQGIRDLEGGGIWNILPGQPTDDSEMALLLARTVKGRDPIREKDVRSITAVAHWHRQHKRWAKLVRDLMS